MQLLAALLELVIDLCARLGTFVLRPLGAPQALGAAYGFVAWMFGLVIFPGPAFRAGPAAVRVRS